MIWRLTAIAGLTTLALLAASASLGAPYSCGPVLLQPQAEGMVIVIDHETPVDATLRYRREGDPVWTELGHPSPERHHIFPLSELTPNTVYTYEIESATGQSSGPYRFRTLPREPERYRLVVMGDVRSQPEVWKRAAERIHANEQQALFMIGTGDYPADGRDYDQWIHQFFVPGRDLLAELPFWPAIGNHERTKSFDGLQDVAESHYFSLFELPGNERWFRVDMRYATILFLDSNSPMTASAPQHRWLRSTLTTPRERFTLVVLHHSPYSSGPHCQLDDAGRPQEWPVDQVRTDLVPLFEAEGVDLVLSGHDHVYERSQKAGVVYVVTGGAGAPLYEIDATENPFRVVAAKTHHYVTLDVDAAAIEVRAIDLEGRVIDRAWIEVTSRPKAASEPASEATPPH